ncbi:MAG: hypothetical protein FWF91_03480 [Coriobacteriia bacterium]|nr:hypothetical protein [Coriobacteriia bacterium]
MDELYVPLSTLGKLSGGVCGVLFTKFLALKKAEQLEAQDLAALKAADQETLKAAEGAPA